MNFPPVSALPAILRQRRKIAIFGIFSSCAQTKQNFGKLLHLKDNCPDFQQTPSEIMPAVSLPIFFMPKLKSFGVAPTSPTLFETHHITLIIIHLIYALGF